MSLGMMKADLPDNQKSCFVSCDRLLQIYPQIDCIICGECV